jgi:hypothetical protein
MAFVLGVIVGGLVAGLVGLLAGACLGLMMRNPVSPHGEKYGDLGQRRGPPPSGSAAPLGTPAGDA